MTGAVIEHPFFGTERVLLDLQRMDGWDEGDVTVCGVTREGRTGQVTGFRGEEAVSLDGMMMIRERRVRPVILAQNGIEKEKEATKAVVVGLI